MRANITVVKNEEIVYNVFMTIEISKQLLTKQRDIFGSKPAKLGPILQASDRINIINQVINRNVIEQWFNFSLFTCIVRKNATINRWKKIENVCGGYALLHLINKNALKCIPIKTYIGISFYQFGFDKKAHEKALELQSFFTSGNNDFKEIGLKIKKNDPFDISTLPEILKKITKRSLLAHCDYQGKNKHVSLIDQNEFIDTRLGKFVFPNEEIKYVGIMCILNVFYPTHSIGRIAQFTKI